VSGNSLWHPAPGARRQRTTSLSSRALRRWRSLRRFRSSGQASGQATRGISALAVLALSGCSWFTDFKHQPKIDPWDSPSDTIPFRGNPQNSVSIYGSAAPGFLYDRLNTPQAVAAMKLIPNPTPPDSASVHRGKLQYQINCAVCHGPSGMGNGNATKYGMPPKPIGVGTNAADTLSDGYIFGMIRNGKGLMPSYNRIEEPDRWDLINYLRSLQGKNGIPADTTHGLPGQTGSFVPGASVSAPTRPAPFVKPGSPVGAALPIDTMRKTPTDTTRKTPADTTRKTPDTTRKTPTDTTKRPEHKP
jgi:mono/diheme cytochrome c family protein